MLFQLIILKIHISLWNCFSHDFTFTTDIGTLLDSFQNLLTNSLSGHSITKLQTGRAISVSAGSINPARANLPNCLSGVFVSVNAHVHFSRFRPFETTGFLRVYR